MPKRSSSAMALILTLALISAGFQCNSQTKNLAVASQAISHALLNAQMAAKQGVQSGAISAQDEQQFEDFLSKAAQAGLTLDQAIRANQSASNVSQQVNAFLEAFNALQRTGVVGIKNPQLQLTISTILTGAEASVAIIAASVGGK